jgi:hypothetical protein
MTTFAAGPLTLIYGVNPTLYINYGGGANALNTSFTPAASAFAVFDGATQLTVDSVTVAAQVIELALSGTVGATDSVTLSYTPPGSNPIQDTAGNLLGAIVSASVTVTSGAPSVICGYIGGPPGSPNARPAYLDADVSFSTSQGILTPSRNWPAYMSPDNVTLTADYWPAPYRPCPGREVNAPGYCRAGQTIRVPRFEIFALAYYGAGPPINWAYWSANFRAPG